MRITLGSIVEEISEKTTKNNQYPVLTSSKSGLYLQSDYFNKQVASINNIGYKVIRHGQFTYRAMSDTGEFFPNMLECTDIGIVSPAYPVFKITNEQILFPHYLKYYFRSDLFQHSISVFAQGSTRTSVKFDKISTITVNLPDISKQKNIVKILDGVNSIILYYQNYLKYFDTLIKARFVEMFGTMPMNSHNWYVGQIRNVVTDVRYGSSRKAAEGNKGKYKYLRMNNITYSGELDLSDVKTIDIPEEELPKCTVRKGDILFNRTNSKELVGKTCVYTLDEMMVLAGFVIRVRLNEKMTPEFLSTFLNMDFSKKMLFSMCKEAIGQANINAQELQNIFVYIPPISLQNEFITFKSQVDKSKVVVQQALEQAQLLFDSLMQKYFS